MSVKFGLILPQGWRLDLTDIRDPVQQYETMIGLAKQAEEAGFDSVWLYDHFHTVPTTEIETTFECWTSMAALARETRRVRLGQMATCHGYRPPSLLAKMASCIDVMSNGRLILGLGAGWHEEEHRAYGFTYGTESEPPPAPGEIVEGVGRAAGFRLRRLEEALQVIKLLWTEERAVFAGEHYVLRGAVNEPKGVQRPHVPLWVAGSGEKRTMRLIATYGDGCNFTHRDPEVVRRKLGLLRERCAEVGSDYQRIEKSTIFNPVVGDEDEQERVLRDYARRSGATMEWVRDRFPNRGSAARVVDQWRKVIDMGIDHILLYLPNVRDDGAIARLAERVLPLVRA